MGFLVQPAIQTTVNPTGFSVAVGLGSPGLNIETGTVEPAGFTIGVSLGTPTVDAMALVNPTGFGITASLGVPSINADDSTNSTVSPSGFSITASLGVPTASVGEQFTETFGNNTTDTYTSVTKSTRFKAGSPLTNYGTSDALFTEWDNNDNNDWTSTLRFDSSSLPSDATVSSATITVTTFSIVPAEEVVIHGYECLRNDWIELEANWNVWKAASNWATAGARGAGTDVTGTPSSTTGSKVTWTVPASTQTDTAITSSNFSSYLQTIVDSGAGFINLALHNEFANGQHVITYSSRGVDGRRPKLTVTYTSALHTDPPTSGPGVTGIYFVHSDGKTYDPDGNEFRAVGSVFEHNKLPMSTHLNYIGTPGWGWTACRVVDLSDPLNFTSTHQSVSDALLTGGKVVWWDWHEVGGFATPGATHPRKLENLTEWWRQQAALYGTGNSKANEKFWYAIYNEPGSSTDNTDASVVGGQIVWNSTRVNNWKTMISSIVNAVRNEGARAPIIIPAMVLSSDIARLTGGYGPSFSHPVGDRSSILKFASEILNAAPTVTGDNGATTKNLIFAVHMYVNYNHADRLQYLEEFLDQCQARGISVVFEEFGLGIFSNGQNTGACTRNVHSVSVDYPHVHLIAWAGDAGDQNNLTQTDGGCDYEAGKGLSGGCGACNYAASVSKRCSVTDVNSVSAPTNLTLSGKVLWNAIHPGTYPVGTI